MEVLVVDDERSCRAIYRRELERGGYKVLEAGDGQEALDILQSESVDLITLDLVLPKMGGFQFCDRLLSRDFACHFHHNRNRILPILIITAHISVSNRVKSLNRGITEFLAKGFYPGTLLKRVNQILKPAHPFQGLRSLLISNHRTTSSELASHLEEMGLETYTATPEEALNPGTGFPKNIDAILIDGHELEGGPAIFSQVQHRLAGMAQPIIVLLPETKKPELLKWFNIGAADFLLHPYSTEDLKAKLKAALAIWSPGDQIIQNSFLTGIKQPSRQSAIPLQNSGLAPQKRQSAVFHNIGNVLNSALVSCSLLRDRVSKSHFWKLSMALDLVRDQGDDILEYLQNDPRGSKLIPYLHKSRMKVEGEFASITDRLHDLETKLQLIRKMISGKPNPDLAPKNMQDLVLAEMVGTALNVLAEPIEMSGVTVRLDLSEEVCVSGRRDLLVHVFINLIKNAIEAMTSTPIKTLIISSEVIIKHVRVTISDNGMGLAQDQLGKLFTQGYTTKEEGHGIGLAFCRRALRRMKGDIQVDSEGPGKGTAFTVQIPIAN